ncbi:MAG: prepilin-type N-terminal cleavage/methylation domain-containing protein [Oscillospiraceae bacterium]
MFRLFRKNNKGFTLVEVIVVLVILAILAAIMIPTMTGWIDKANEKTGLVKARNVLLAAQTIVSEAYGEKTDPSNMRQDIMELAEIRADDSGYKAEIHYDKATHKVCFILCEFDSHKYLYYIHGNPPVYGFAVDPKTTPTDKHQVIF